MDASCCRVRGVWAVVVCGSKSGTVCVADASYSLGLVGNPPRWWADFTVWQARREPSNRVRCYCHRENNSRLQNVEASGKPGDKSGYNKCHGQFAESSSDRQPHI